MTVSSSLRPWRPLLHGEPAQRVLRITREIADALRRRVAAQAASTSTPAAHFSLGGGNAGIALFFAYLAETFPAEGYEDTALELLEQAIDGMGAFATWPGLYGGFPGVAWVVEHLQGRLFDPAEEDPCEEVIASLESYLGRSPWQGDFDLISGLVGLGVLALERRPRSSGDRCLDLVVARLGEIAERSARGITWWSAPEHLTAETRVFYPQGNYNLGVAHGLPGAIALLAEAQAAGVAEDAARSLLAGAVPWLLAQEQPPDAGSRFSYAVAPGGGEPRPCRLAWCYGDLGIAAALLAAARCAGEPAWEQRALAIARSAAERPVDSSGVIDMGLCHGAAGAAHLFNRLYQASGEPALATSARFWLEQALGMQREGEGISGFVAYVPDDQGELGWRGDPGFLTGVAGLGLALLAAATPIEPAWDRVLLAAVPPAPHDPGTD
jgi:lantibiotic biosynthesis protein